MSEQAPAVAGIAALAVDCADPPELAGWWSRLLGGEVEVDEDGATLHTPGGLNIDFARVPDTKTGKNRLHLDLYPTGRDNALPMDRRIEIVEAKVAELVGLGASVERRTREDDPEDPVYFVVMHDPEGNEFCVG